MEVMSKERIWKWVDLGGDKMAILVEFSKEPGELEYKKREVCNFGDCQQYYPTEGTEPSDSDKQLIAAAPDLLEALERLQPFIDEDIDSMPLTKEYQASLNARTAAINKAKGIKP